MLQNVYTNTEIHHYRAAMNWARSEYMVAKHQARAAHQLQEFSLWGSYMSRAKSMRKVLKSTSRDLHRMLYQAGKTQVMPRV